MNEERIRKIFSDEAFVKQLLEQEEAEQVVALLKEKGAEVTVDDVIQFKTFFEKYINGEIQEEELNDNALEEVSGGGFLTANILLICGILAGTAVMATGGAAYAVNSDMRSRRRRW